MPEQPPAPVTVDGHVIPITVAQHIVVDRQHHTVTVDGESLPWTITGSVEVIAEEFGPGSLPAVEVGILAERATIAADGELIIDDKPLRWAITDGGPSILVALPNHQRSRMLIVVIALLADRVTEIPAEPEEANRA